MREALSASGRPIIFGMCEWGTAKPWLWARDIGNLWRTTGDITDQWESKNKEQLGVLNILDLQDGLESFSGPGHWNDPDMLEVGNGGMTIPEYQAHFSLWAILAAPLISGNDLRDMKPEIQQILTNREVIAVDQDKLGTSGQARAQGRRSRGLGQADRGRQPRRRPPQPGYDNAIHHGELVGPRLSGPCDGTRSRSLAAQGPGSVQGQLLRAGSPARRGDDYCNAVGCEGLGCDSVGCEGASFEVEGCEVEGREPVGCGAKGCDAEGLGRPPKAPGAPGPGSLIRNSTPIVVSTSTASPSSVNGEKRQFLTASMAAFASSEEPLAGTHLQHPARLFQQPYPAEPCPESLAVPPACG